MPLIYYLLAENIISTTKEIWIICLCLFRKAFNPIYIHAKIQKQQNLYSKHLLSLF
jgi:hypothetical protein